MDIRIRQCEIGDVKAVYELNAEEMGYDYPLDKTGEKLRRLLKSDKDKIFVAVIDNVIVGEVTAPTAFVWSRARQEQAHTNFIAIADTAGISRR